MSSFFSGSSLTFNQIIPSGRGKRAFGTLFLVASLVIVASMLAFQGTRATTPVLSGGGPPVDQVGVPGDALIDINSQISLNAGMLEPFAAQTSGGAATDIYGVHFVSTTKGFAVGLNGVCFATSDAGTTWNSEDIAAADLNKIFCPSASVCYAVGNATGGRALVFKATNIASVSSTNPTTAPMWVQQTSAGIPNLGLENIYCFAGATTAEDTCYAVGGSANPAPVIKTTNGGTDWAATSGSTGINGTLFGIHCTDVNTCYAVGTGGAIVRTVNGGTNWSALTSGVAEQLSEVFFVNATTGWVVGDTNGTNGRILKTTNGNAATAGDVTFTAQTNNIPNLYIQTVYFLDANNGYVGGTSSTLRKTADGGTTWTSQVLSGDSGDVVDMYFVNGGTGWAVGSANLVLSKTLNVRLQANAGNTQGGAPGGANLCTSVDLSSNTRVVCNHDALATSTWYTVTYVAGGIMDGSGSDTMGANVTRKFQTSSFTGGGGAGNTTPFRILNSVPTPGSQFPANGRITLQFPQGPEGNVATSGDGSVNDHVNYTLKVVTGGATTGSDLCTSAGNCAITYVSGARLALLAPSPALAVTTPPTEYELQVSGLKNSVGASMTPPLFVRFTVTAADSTAPALRTANPTVPADAATGVSRFAGDISVFFSETVRPDSISVTNVSLYADADLSSTRNNAETALTNSALLVSYDDVQKAARILPIAPLTADTRYCFQILGGVSGVKDLVDNQITPVANKCFTTNAVNDTTKPTLLAADADNFKLVARFSELVKSGAGTNGAENPANYQLECPTGVQVNLSSGKTLVYRPERRELEIQGLGCPNGQNGKLTVLAGLQDINGQSFNTDSDAVHIAQFQVQNATTTGGNLGGAPAGTGFFEGTSGQTAGTFWERPQRCQPRAQATSASTTLECEFPVPAALSTGATVQLTFPSGFSVGSAAAPDANVSFMNNDLNGPGPGRTTISGVSGSGDTVTVTLAHTGDVMVANDMLRFELSGITNPSIPADGLRVSVVVKNSSGIKQGQTIQPSPFPIQQAGSLQIKGRVMKGVTGISGIKLFCDQMGGFQVGMGGAVGMMGHQEATTDGSGDYTISGLTSGQYGCNIPPQTALNNASVGGSSPFQNVVLASASKGCVAGDRADCVDFKFSDLSGASGKTITISVTGAPAATEMDAFCFAPGNFQSSAPVMKAFTTANAGAGTSTGSTTLKLQANTNYDCGIGPHMAFENFGNGTPPPPPTFTFMPPPHQQVLADADKSITFPLVYANQTISGTVVDGSSTGIANMFVHAEPVGCFDATTGAQKDCRGAFTQTRTDGTFTLSVSDGCFDVGADGPGLPSSTRVNACAKGASVTGLTLKMVKSSTTISGTVSDESGNGIKYAHVSGQKIASGGTCSSFTPAGGFADSPTDSSGNYTLYTAAGTWCVRAFAPSYGEIGNKVVVVSSTSQSGQNIAATASEYGTITATITSGGSAVTSGFFNCFGSSGGNNAQIGSDGTLSMKVKYGSYTCDGFVPGVGPITRQTSVVVAANINSGVTGLGTIILGNPATITVTITGISDAFCDARSSTGVGSGAPLNAGVATIKVQAGTYTVRCGGPKYGNFTLSSSSVVAVASQTYALTGTAPTTQTFTGRVTDGTSNLEGATLTFTDTTTKSSFNVTTGSCPPLTPNCTTSNLSATGIPNGTYAVTATKQGYEGATTTATVSGSSTSLSSSLALTPTTGTSGDDVKIQVNSDSAAYTGDAKVVATKDGKTVVGEIDANTGIATLNLTQGAWSITAIGDNGKQTTSASTVTVNTSGETNSPESGSVDKTVSLATTITGFTSANESQTVALSSGGLLKYEDLSVAGVAPEVNVPSSTLSTSDSSTGKVDMTADPTVAAIDPGTSQNFVGSSGYEITPKDADGNPITDINGTVTITIPYTDASVTTAGVSESKLQLASFDTSSQTWETFPTTVDTTNNLLIASVTHFSSFGIIGGLSTAQSTSSTLDLTPPAAATNVRLTSNGISVTATWTDPADSDFSRIVVLRNDGGTTPVTGDARAIVTKGDQRYVDTTVTAGTTYKYILKSQDTTLNQRLTDEYSVAVTAAATGTVSAPATSAPPAASAPAASAPAASAPSASAPVASGAPVARLIHDPSQLEALLSGLGVARKQSEEAKYMPLIKSDAVAFKVGLTAAQEATITNFVSYGASEKTKQLGAGERRAVIRDYLETVGRGNVNWDDVERMTKGEKPVARNLAKEQAQVSAALKIFTKIYGHAPVFSVPAEDLSWNTLMYRIRFPRDLDKEKTGITEYRALYKRTPRSTMDWATVRVLGYVQM